ncbi:MAG: hypothetical protein QGD94_04660, partial [Planctomycetia bacterium]|nr:hypothetical protein [Planctomycetia bacterium]
MAKSEKSPWRWYLYVGLPVLLALLAAGTYWLYPRTTYFYYGGGETWEAGESSPARFVMWSKPKRLGKEINAGSQTYKPDVGPNGQRLYFTRGLAGHNADIFVADRQGEQWVNSRSLKAVNSEYDDIGASITPDGRRMYFYSDRPGGQGGYDLWVSENAGGAWQKPTNLGPDVNSGANEYDPSVSPDGTYLLFSSNRAGKSTRGVWGATLREKRDTRDHDIYVLDLSADKPAEPYPLSGLNTGANEGQPVVSPRGDFIYFASDREGGQGGYDIWRARITGKSFKSFAGAENLGAEVNTPGNDMDPLVTGDGFGLLFASNHLRQGAPYEIFQVASTEVEKYTVTKSVNLDYIVGRLGWPLIGLLVALVGMALLLLAVLKFRHRPGLLATCLGTSVALHLLALLLFSLYVVKERVHQLGPESKKYKVTVSIPSLKESELGEAIRKKILEMVTADEKQFDSPKASELKAAEAEMEKAQPELADARPEAPSREQIEIDEMSKPQQKLLEQLKALQEKSPELLKLEMARLEQMKVKREAEKVAEPLKPRELKTDPVVKPLEMPKVQQPKPREIALKPVDLAPTREEIEIAATRPIELKVEDKLQKVPEKLPEVTQVELARLEQLKVERKARKVVEAAIEARLIEAPSSRQGLKTPEAPKRETRAVAVNAAQLVRTKQQIEVETKRQAQQKVEQRLLADVQPQTRTVENVTASSEKVQPSTRPAKTTGRRQQNPTATLRFAKAAGVEVKAPSPKVLAPRVTRFVAKSPTASLARGKIESTTARRPTVDANVATG